MKTFEVEILFHTSSSPKRMKDVVAVYTKDSLLCVQRSCGMIVKYPLLNIFQISHMHGQHSNSSIKDYVFKRD